MFGLHLRYIKRSALQIGSVFSCKNPILMFPACFWLPHDSFQQPPRGSSPLCSAEKTRNSVLHRRRSSQIVRQRRGIVYLLKCQNKTPSTTKSEILTNTINWFRYVGDTWVRIRTREVEDFTEHINAADNNIMFTREEHCAVHIKDDRSLNVEVFTENLHADQYLLFNSHHPPENKLGVIRTLNH